MQLKFRVRPKALWLAAPIIPAALWWSLHAGPGRPIQLQVSLSARQLDVIEGGTIVAKYGVAVGRPSHPTPTGSFHTGEIVWNPSWTPPPSGWARNKHFEPSGSPLDPMVGVKIYFRAPDLYIHGTNDPGSIGEAASHGCIRMNPDDAIALAHQIQAAGGHVPLRIVN